MRHVDIPVGRPAAYVPGASTRSAVTVGVTSHTLNASPSSAYAPSRVPANARPEPAPTMACTAGMSARQPFTTGATGHAGRPFLSSHAFRAASSRYSPRSVPTHATAPVSGAIARTRSAHSAVGHRTGVGYSVQVRPPSVERAKIGRAHV